MFGLTKREQRWKAEQRVAETIMPVLIAAIEAKARIEVAENAERISQPDCRGCRSYLNCRGLEGVADLCTNGDKYAALPIVKLYKVTPEPSVRKGTDRTTTGAIGQP